MENIISKAQIYFNIILISENINPLMENKFFSNQDVDKILLGGMKIKEIINQYGFKFDDIPAGDDDVLDCGGFNILLDSLSYPYLYGSTLDYVEDLSGSRFLIANPNAKTTCGCGESFTI